MQFAARNDLVGFRETDYECEYRTNGDDAAKYQDSLRPSDGGSLEEESREDRSKIAARSDDAGNRSKGALIDERHKRIRCAVRHFYEEASQHHRANGGGQPGHS